MAALQRVNSALGRTKQYLGLRKGEVSRLCVVVHWPFSSGRNFHAKLRRSGLRNAHQHAALRAVPAVLAAGEGHGGVVVLEALPRAQAHVCSAILLRCVLVRADLVHVLVYVGLKTPAHQRMPQLITPAIKASRLNCRRASTS